jgi:aspartate/methionine/tyrosine aminotransferase
MQLDQWALDYAWSVPISATDNAWGFLAQASVTPLQALAPQSVIYLTSFSKSLAPGLRVGYVAVCQAPLRSSIASCVGTATWAAPLCAEIATRWVNDGTAWRSRSSAFAPQRNVCRSRHVCSDLASGFRPYLPSMLLKDYGLLR